MEKEQNHGLKILSLIFVIITVFYVFYASCSCRGLYLDGSFWLIMFLDRIGEDVYSIHTYLSRPRFMCFYLIHFPIDLVGFFFRNLTDKITFSTIFSFTMFTLPVLGLWWNYELTKRTKQYAILFWSIFTYSTMILLYQIFSVVETAICLPFQFVLLNYLVGKINYTKLDKIGILFIIALQFGIYEHTLFVGAIIFAIMFTCLYDEENKNNLLTKIIIGTGSLAASAYTLLYILLSKEEQSELGRFLNEAIDFMRFWNQTNLLVTIVTVLLLIALVILARRSKKISNIAIFSMGLIYTYLLIYMFGNIQTFLNPIFEQHTRSIPVWFVPLLFFAFFIAKLKKVPEKKLLFERLYIPVLFCGITLTVWQIVTTFYWNENVSYMKECIKNCEKPIYIPSQETNKEISSFFSPTLRRFIWNANFMSTALALEPDNKIEKIIMHYAEESVDKNNPSKRSQQYADLERGVIGMPYDRVVNIKNKFWDLTEPAKALEEYNKKNSIKTLKEENNDEIEEVVAMRKNRKK